MLTAIDSPQDAYDPMDLGGGVEGCSTRDAVPGIGCDQMAKATTLNGEADDFGEVPQQ